MLFIDSCFAIEARMYYKYNSKNNFYTKFIYKNQHNFIRNAKYNFVAELYGRFVFQQHLIPDIKQF